MLLRRRRAVEEPLLEERPLPRPARHATVEVRALLEAPLGGPQRAFEPLAVLGIAAALLGMSG